MSDGLEWLLHLPWLISIQRVRTRKDWKPSKLTPSMHKTLGSYKETWYVAVLHVTLTLHSHALVCSVPKVEIGLLHDLPLAQSVATEPLSADDWEIIVRAETMSSPFGIVTNLIHRKSTRPTSSRHYSPK